MNTTRNTGKLVWTQTATGWTQTRKVAPVDQAPKAPSVNDVLRDAIRAAGSKLDPSFAPLATMLAA